MKDVHTIRSMGLRRAANVYQWVIDPYYMGGYITPYPRQLFELISFLGEYCPIESCSNIEVIRQLPNTAPLADMLSNVTLLDHGVCPKCGADKATLINSGQLYPTPTLLVRDSPRTGKTTMVVGMLATYHLHQLLAISPLDVIYQLTPPQTLRFDFYAASMEIARETLWSVFTKAYDQSSWFSEYNAYISKHAPDQFRRDSKRIVYLNKSLFITYGAFSHDGIRGFTRVFTVRDETPWTLGDQPRSLKDSYLDIESGFDHVRHAARIARIRGAVGVPDGLHIGVVTA